MTNPLLAEINGLSPGAKAALQQAHQQASTPAAPPKLITDPNGPNQLPPAIGAAPAPTGPPPGPAHIAAPPPDLPSSQAPSITAPRGTVQGDTSELGRLVKSGSGISQIHSNIENSNFGQNHPLLGKVLGWGAQVPAMLADTAASAVAPGIAVNVPGTEYHHERLVNQGTRQLAQDVGNQKDEAQTQEANARTTALNAPAPDEVTPLSTDSGIYGFHKRGGEVTPLNGPDNQQLQPVEKPQAQNVHVLPDGKVVAISNGPDGKPKADIVYQGDPAVKTEVKQLEIGGKPHQVLINSASGETIKDLGETGEKPPVINVNADRRAKDANTEKEYTAAKKEMSGSFGAAQTQLESVDEAQKLIGSGAVGQALGTVKTMVAIAGGKGSGVRITQAELNSIAKARGVQGNFEGWVNGLEGKGNYSPQQIQQVKSILGDVQQKIRQKQQLLSDSLDKLDSAGSTDEVRAIQRDYRHASMGDTGGAGGATHSVSLKAAMALPANKGKSEADVRKDITSHGYQVGQ